MKVENDFMKSDATDSKLDALSRIANALETIVDKEKRTLRMVDVDRAKVYGTHLGGKLREQTAEPASTVARIKELEAKLTASEAFAAKAVETLKKIQELDDAFDYGFFKHDRESPAKFQEKLGVILSQYNKKGGK